MRWRTPIAGFVMLFGLSLYVAGAINLADYLPANGLLEVLYYLVAGLLWVPPMLAVLKWASRDPGTR